MIDIAREHVVLLNKAPQEVAHRPHVSTFWRWSRGGLKGVRLETVVIGGRRYKSREALQRFFQELNKHRDAAPPRPDRLRDLERQPIDQQLDEAGL